MKKQSISPGRWELGCMVFLGCFYKMFTTYPRRFGQISGRAGWLTALFAGLVFLALLWVILWLWEKGRIGEKLLSCGGWVKKGIHGALALYWLFSAALALREFTGVLQSVAYPRSPLWFLLLFLLSGTVVMVFCGRRAVFRMHSLTVPSLGFGIALILLLSLRHADPSYLAPWLEKGAGNVFGRGLSTLFLYTDILLIFPLLPHCPPRVKGRRTVLIAASVAVLFHVGVVLMATLTHAAAATEFSGNLLYPLAKMASFGRFPIRLDGIYLVGLICSEFLYLSLAITLFLDALGGWGGILRGRKGGAAALCLFLCLFLSGCYDSREVEQAAYAIGLGIDRGEAGYRYTFQLSNPLELGGSVKTEAAPMAEEGEEEKNKTVTNLSVEADSFYTAVDRMKSHLSKEPDFSHLKIIVFSEEVAKEGILEEAALLLGHREIRPDVHLCLTDSGEELLGKVKPALEQSTSRYYELLFQKKNSPYAPVVTLREFVTDGKDGGKDPVLPIAKAEQMEGMGLFQAGVLTQTVDGETAMLYRLINGSGREIVMTAGESAFSLTSVGKPKIQVKKETNPPQIAVQPRLRAELLQGQASDLPHLAASLEEKTTRFLQETFRASTDPLGVGRVLRRGKITQNQWEEENWRENMVNFDIVSQTSLSLSPNLQNVEKFD